MKKIFLFFLLIPFVGIGQSKNVINAFRVFPKPEKNAEFEKGLGEHARKFHKDNWKWRVYEIQTGPDAGGFHVLEGPLSWAEFDGRGDLGLLHTADWNKNVAPYTTSMGTQSYSTYQADLSTVQLSDYSDKIVITHMFPKPGMVNGVIQLIKQQKKVWEQSGGETVAVYLAAFSGAPQYLEVTRLKTGLKELDDSFRKPFPERYNAAHGEGSWTKWLDDYSKSVESRWTEILSLRKDLGSK